MVDSRALEAEALLAHVAGVQEALEHLGRVEAVEDVALLLEVERDGLTLDVLLDPALLLGILDVHVLDAQGAAVRVAQHVEDVLEGGRLAARQPVGHELTRQVPDGEAVGQRVELGVDVRRLGIERVEVGDQVPAHPVHVDERLHPHLLEQPLVLGIARADACVVVALPAHRLVRHAHRLEERIVEAVGSGQERRDPGQEEPRLCALDDAVVVGGREGHDLAQAEFGQQAGVGGLVAGRVPERTHTDDGPLPGHEARHRLHGAQGPRIRERDRRPGEVVGADLVRVDLADEILVGQHEGAEVQGVRFLDARDEQRAAAVALLLVHGQPQADVLVMDDARLPRAVGILHERRVQRGHVTERPHDGVADHVGEAHLGPRRPCQLVVEDQAVDLEQAGRDRAHACRRGHGQAGLHVGHDP